MDDTQRTPLENKQKAMIAVLVAFLIALFYLLFLRGGGADMTAAPPAVPAPIAQASAEDPFDPSAGGATSQPVETYEIFASRDPFAPLVEGGGTGSSDKGPADGSGEAANPDEEQGLGDGEIATGAQANQEEVAGRTVKLVDVFREDGRDRAQVEIDSTGYTVSPGEVFAENFQLVSTSRTCATMLYGDDQFTLCEGDEILK